MRVKLAMGWRIEPTTHHDKAGKPFLIREATSADASAVLKLCRQIYAEKPPGILTLPAEFFVTVKDEQKYLARMRASKTDAFLIAVRPRTGAILGFVSGRVQPRERLRHVWTLGIMIAKRARGAGVGRALMLRAIDYVRTHPDLAKVALNVVADNWPALALYRSLGFIEEGRRIKQVFRDGQFIDELLMYIWLGDAEAVTDGSAGRGAGGAE